jgi:hypothetical protein
MPHALWKEYWEQRAAMKKDHSRDADTLRAMAWTELPEVQI